MLTGLEVKVNSLQLLLTGGIAFATPETSPGDAAKDGDQFVIHDEAKKEWTSWAPKFAIDPAGGNDPEKKIGADKAKEAIKSAVGGK